MARTHRDDGQTLEHLNLWFCANNWCIESCLLLAATTGITLSNIKHCWTKRQTCWNLWVQIKSQKQNNKITHTKNNDTKIMQQFLMLLLFFAFPGLSVFFGLIVHLRTVQLHAPRKKIEHLKKKDFDLWALLSTWSHVCVNLWKALKYKTT